METSTTIIKMLIGNRIFVPDYQRAYSWDKNIKDGNFKNQVNTFLLDLEDYLQSDAYMRKENKIPFKVRELEESSAKVVMAKAAAELIEDGSVVFLDSSTSAYNIIPFLGDKKNLTVITNGVRALERLAGYGINTVSTGGTLDPSCMSLVGDEAHKTIEAFNADICFFSCRGLDSDGNMTDIFSAENYVRQRMIKHSKRAYLLCAGDKFGKKYFHNLMNLKAVDGLISDRELTN